MKGTQKMSIPTGGTVYGLQELDYRFDRGVLRIAYHGKNRNGSRISKEDFERNAQSAWNTPIVCHYIREENQLGGHDIDIVATEDGAYRLVNVTHPVGFVPYGSSFWWEQQDDDGVEHEYFCTDALIWKREEPYELIRQNRFTKESMEIDIHRGGTNDGVYDIFDFDYTAFCLLGDDIDPCFEGAGLALFSADAMGDMAEEYSRLLEDMKQSAENIQLAFGTNTNKPQAEINQEGGNDLLEKKTELMATYQLTEEDLDFSLEDAPLDGLEDKLREISEKKYSLTAEQTLAELDSALSAVKFVDEWGEQRSRYWYIDHDNDLGMVYCYDRCADWHIIGFGYAMNGDHAVIDFESGKRMKVAYVDFEDGDPEPFFSFSKVLQENADSVKAAAQQEFQQEKAELENRFSEKTAEAEALQNQVNELNEYRLNAEAEAKKASADAVFAKFEALNGNEAFEQLRENYGDMSAEDIEEKCYAICGRYGVRMNGKEEPKSTRYRLDGGAKDTVEPYGGIVAKYKNKK